MIKKNLEEKTKLIINVSKFDGLKIDYHQLKCIITDLNFFRERERDCFLKKRFSILVGRVLKSKYNRMATVESGCG